MSGSQATQSQANAQKNRELRSQIRTLHLEARHDKDDLTRLGSNKLSQMLDKAETLQQQVNKPREQALDTELFHHLSEVGLEFAKKLVNGTQGISCTDIVRRVAARYAHGAASDDPTAMQWQHLGAQAARLFNVAPGVCCMLGPLDAQPKARKAPAARAKRAAVGAAVGPEELQQLQEGDKQETDRNMEEMWKVVKGAGVVPLPELVCNHASFGQTVENMFTLSFLVRDARVRLGEGREGTMVEAVVRQKGQAPAPAQERQQFIIVLDFEEWERMRSMVSPDDCMMPHRERHAEKRPAEAAPEQPPAARRRGGQAEAGEDESQGGEGGAAAAADCGGAPDGTSHFEEDQENEEPGVVLKGKKRLKKKQ